jgi:hypothetical protein
MSTLGYFRRTISTTSLVSEITAVAFAPRKEDNFSTASIRLRSAHHARMALSGAPD